MSRSTYVAPLYEGTFSVGLDKKFIRIPRDGRPNRASLKISLHPFLIRTADKNILFDCGIGEFGEATGPKYIRESLEEHDLHDFEITDIFLSHLHYDHIGGLAHKENGFWELTFPEAKVWVSEVDWKRVVAKELYYDDEKTEFIAFIDARADLHFMRDGDLPYPEIRVEHIGGHTEHHLALYFDDGQHKYLQAGDVIATRSQINRKFAAKYDFEPQVSQQQRERLTEFAHKHGFIILAYHDDEYPIIKITGYNDKSGYLTEAVSTYAIT